MALLKHNVITGAGFEDKSQTFAPPVVSKKGLLKGGSYSPFDPDQNKSFAGEPEQSEAGEIMELQEEIPEELPAATSILTAPPPPPQPKVDRLIIEEAEKKAEEIIRKARAEAKKLIEETKLYSQSAFEQAETDGFAKGKDEGFEAGKGEMVNLIKDAKNVLTQVLRERELLLRSIEPDVAKLAIRIAEKIIKCQIDIDNDTVVSMIRSALESVKQREEVIIKVNQEDYYYAKEKREVFASMVEGLKLLDIVVDSGVERGGCIIETNLGNVDARISTQIHTLELAFDKVSSGEDEDISPVSLADEDVLAQEEGEEDEQA